MVTIWTTLTPLNPGPAALLEPDGLADEEPDGFSCAVCENPIGCVSVDAAAAEAAEVAEAILESVR